MNIDNWGYDRTDEIYEHTHQQEQEDEIERCVNCTWSEPAPPDTFGMLHCTFHDMVFLKKIAKICKHYENENSDQVSDDTDDT